MLHAEAGGYQMEDYDDNDCIDKTRQLMEFEAVPHDKIEDPSPNIHLDEESVPTEIESDSDISEENEISDSVSDSDEDVNLPKKSVIKFRRFLPPLGFQ